MSPEEELELHYARLKIENKAVYDNVKRIIDLERRGHYQRGYHDGRTNRKPKP